MFVSALTGYGLETLRAEIAALLASLWVDVDLAVPYAAGELLARVRERGTIELEYRERDVRVRGRITPSLAGELEVGLGPLDGVPCSRDERAAGGRDPRSRDDPTVRSAGPGTARWPTDRASPGRSRKDGAAGAGARSDLTEAAS